jgi:arylsulfatase
MLGSRALYHDGWKAVVFRPLPLVRYTAEDDPDRSFEDDDWELYHVAEDFSETRDLAAERPEKLAELVDIWWQEAERHNVLPVTNMPITGADPRYRRRRYVFYPGIGTIPQLVAPNISNRAWSLRAELIVPATGAEGALVCHGSHAGGYVVFLRHGRLHLTYNHLGTTLTTIAAEVVLPTGPVEARIEFSPTGAHAGDVDLFYGDVPVGQGHILRTTLVTVGVHGFTVGYQRGSAIDPGFAGRRDITPGALRRVVIETFSDPHRTPPAEDRAGLASQ